MRHIFLVLCLLKTSLIFSQTGPGGVGDSSNNGLWLKADDLTAGNGTTISSWSDASGNSNDAEQTSLPDSRPTFYSTSDLNNMPIVRFDGGNDEMAVSDVDILDNSTGITYYVVLRPNNLNGSPKGILGKRVSYSVSANYSYTWFFYSGNRLNLDVVTLNDRFDTGTTTFSNATNYILGWDFDGTKAGSVRSRIRNGSEITTTSSETSSSILNGNQNLAIGALNEGYGQYLGADYAEIIQYNYYHNEIENILVNNYLSAKYAIPLVSNDVYDEDEDLNGNYDFDVAGIGQTSGGESHTASQGSGIIAISNPSDLNNDEFFMWGHDNGALSATNTTDIPGSIQARFERVWRVSEVNSAGSSVDVGEIDLSFDLTGLGSFAAADLRLLVDEDNDGVFTDETPIDGAVNVGGNIFEFQDITAINNDNRFTLAIFNTALPIELTYFNAEVINNNYVNLLWQTASETDNDYFTVERSKDGINWENLTIINGSRNSSTLLSYSTRDQNPYNGISYYRLKQTDFDGQFSYSNAESVLLNKSSENRVKVFPNPTTNQITIASNSVELGEMRIYNTKGIDVTSSVKLMKINEFNTTIDLSYLPPGRYYVKTRNITSIVTKLEL